MNIKHFLPVAALLLLPVTSHALSFMEGTIFLEAETKAECDAQGGSFIEWYGEIYCTQEGDTSVSVETPEPSIEEVFAEQIAASEKLNLAGKTEAQAAQLAAQVDVPFRVVERDGEMLMVTEDYRPGRINATVQNSIITSYSIEGTNITVTAQTNTNIGTTPPPTNLTPAEPEPAEPTVSEPDDQTPAEEPQTEEPTPEPSEPARTWWRVIIDLFIFWR